MEKKFGLNNEIITARPGIGVAGCGSSKEW
jgi:hypothetical protein